MVSSIRLMSTDWVTISSLATAGGTLALAVSTFSAVRSANRAARVAEEALMVGVRPLLVASRLSDEPQKIHYGDGRRVVLRGGFGVAEAEGGVVYLAVSVRNAGRGVAVLRGWRLAVGDIGGAQSPRPELDDFQRQHRDLYIAPADLGFWQGALRDEADPQREDAAKAIDAGEVLTIDILYGDFEGGQRVISRFMLTPREISGEMRWFASVGRHWNVDRPDPRERG